MDQTKKQITIDYSYLRPKKAEFLQHLHENFLYKQENLTVSAYQNATVLPLTIFDKVASYLDRYKQYDYLQIYMEKWLLSNLDHRYEAYVDTLRYLGKYLNGSKPYRVSQYFTLFYLKKCVSRWLRRIRAVG